ncbi:MAG: hypothetical protein KIT00_00890 [Rhodospirillales bacterium]|nr:hypothetical protein [Rhodospirillales bacterium]
MTLTVILDLTLAMLLAVTIIYAALLNHKLALLRRERQQLDQAAGGLQETLVRAEQSIEGLKSSTEGLKDRVEKSHKLCDDLSFLIHRGESLADNLEGRVKAPAPTKTTTPERGPASKAKAKPKVGLSKEMVRSEAQSEAERELLNALGAVNSVR